MGKGERVHTGLIAQGPNHTTRHTYGKYGVYGSKMLMNAFVSVLWFFFFSPARRP